MRSNQGDVFARALPLLLILLGVGVTQAVSLQEAIPLPATIEDIKAHPAGFDGKTVRLSGWLVSGHLGMALYSEDRSTAVHLRHPDDVASFPKQRVKKDEVFDEFWALGETETKDVRTERRHAELEGVVRLLKINGKPPKDFYVFGQFPVELIPVRILRVSTEPNLPKDRASKKP